MLHPTRALWALCCFWLADKSYCTHVEAPRLPLRHSFVLLAALAAITGMTWPNVARRSVDHGENHPAHSLPHTHAHRGRNICDRPNKGPERRVSKRDHQHTEPIRACLLTAAISKGLLCSNPGFCLFSVWCVVFMGPAQTFTPQTQLWFDGRWLMLWKEPGAVFL